MIHFIIVFFSVAVIFIFFKRICIWTWGATTMPASHWAFYSMFLQVHLAVPQSVVQLHLMIFKSSAGAGGISVSTGCNPVSLRTHPHSSASKSHWGSFHWFVCRKTRLLWNLAEAEVGGKTLGSTCVKLVATLSQYFLYRRLSKVQLTPAITDFKGLTDFTRYCRIAL